jgi:hypothetical protein
MCSGGESRQLQEPQRSGHDVWAHLVVPLAQRAEVWYDAEMVDEEALIPGDG